MPKYTANRTAITVNTPRRSVYFGVTIRFGVSASINVPGCSIYRAIARAVVLADVATAA